jgi:hypothetical protein
MDLNPLCAATGFVFWTRTHCTVPVATCKKMTLFGIFFANTLSNRIRIFAKMSDLLK